MVKAERAAAHIVYRNGICFVRGGKFSLLLEHNCYLKDMNNTGDIFSVMSSCKVLECSLYNHFLIDSGYKLRM